jgi:hypothetical protein
MNTRTRFMSVNIMMSPQEDTSFRTFILKRIDQTDIKSKDFSSDNKTHTYFLSAEHRHVDAASRMQSFRKALGVLSDSGTRMIMIWL